MLKKEHIINSLSKISHKKWELYVISRIIHLLDDEEIEFVCQQYVKSRSGKRYLTDLCFPQLKLYCEIDEDPHGEENHIISDKHRQREIMDVTNFQEIRIRVFNETNQKNLTNGETTELKSLKQINTEVNDFINLVKIEKQKLVTSGKFIPWDPSTKFDAKKHIKRGYIDVSDNVVFLTHRDALKCFGYKKGHYQPAAWKIPETDKQVWFPKLYKNKDWDNDLSENFDTITMKYIGNDITKFKRIRHKTITKNIVFAHYKNLLGKVVYKFLGEFHTSLEDSNSQQVVYKLTSRRVELP